MYVEEGEDMSKIEDDGEGPSTFALGDDVAVLLALLLGDNDSGDKIFTHVFCSALFPSEHKTHIAFTHTAPPLSLLFTGGRGRHCLVPMLSITARRSAFSSQTLY